MSDPQERTYDQGSSPDQGSTPAVPGAAAASTTPGGNTSGVDPQQIQQLKDMLSHYAKPHPQMTMPPVQSKVRHGSLAGNIGQSLLSTFVPFVGGAVQTAVKAQRETMINDVVYKMQTIGNEMEMAEYISQGDPEKKKQYLNQSPIIKALFADKKFVKGVSKVFGGDMLNPEKQNTVFHEGMKRYLKMKPAGDKVKEMFGQMQQRQQEQGDQQQGGQPQQTPGGGAPQQGQPPQGAQSQVGNQQQPQPQQGQQGQQGNTPGDILNKLPQKLEQGDPTKVAQLSNALRQAETSEKYGVGTDAQGNQYAYDKTNPSNPVIPLKFANGETVGARRTVSSKDGQTVKVGKMPVGVWGNGHVKRPGDPDWTPVDDRHLAQDKAAYDADEKNMLARQEKVQEVRARWWNSERAKYMFYNVTDAENKGTFQISAADLHNSPPGKYVAANTAQQQSNRQAIYSEIEVGVKQLNDEINKLPDTPMDAVTRAQLIVALKDDDPRSAFDNFLSSSAASSLSDQQIEYVTALANMQESAMALRTLGGQGQGSDMLRAAILKMVPNAGVPSKKYAQSQMVRFTNQVSSLKTGLLKLGKQPPTKVYKKGEVPD